MYRNYYKWKVSQEYMDLWYKNIWKLYEKQQLKNFSSNLEITPNIFLYFFQPQIDFWTHINVFRKKIRKQNLISYVHNVVMNTQKLEFFPFLGKTFFKNAQKRIFLLYGFLMYALINVWYLKFKIEKNLFWKFLP